MITLHGEIHSSKNSRRILRTRDGRTFVAKSEAAKADENMLLFQLDTQHGAWLRMTAPLLFPLHIVFKFRRGSRRAFDYVNIVQGVLDAMVKAEYLPDDNANFVIPSFAPYEVNRDNPGCDFWIQKEG